MQQKMNAAHGRGDANCADVRWSFVCPERELHGVRPAVGPAECAPNW